jgi:Superinfection immunity protein
MGSFSLMHWVIVLIILGLIFVPTYIAFARKLQRRVAILILNILVGWTGIGWIVLLIWSVASSATERQAAA